jgi:hypothetical protein
MANMSTQGSFGFVLGECIAVGIFVAGSFVRK